MYTYKRSDLLAQSEAIEPQQPQQSAFSWLHQLVMQLCKQLRIEMTPVRSPTQEDA